MSRIVLILTGLGAVLLVALFYVTVLQPAREDLAAVEELIAQEEAQQDLLRASILRLETVRERAPEVEADLAFADAIVPAEPALPALVRQVQTAADEAGLVLASISLGRPSEVPDGPVEGLSSIDVNLQVLGGYFQLIDFLRRVEDPGITPRGMLWNSTTIARPDGQYPQLQIGLSGRTFAVIEVPVPPEPEPELEPTVPGDEEPDGDEDEEGSS